MFEHRRNSRFQSSARVIIEGVSEEETHLKDISVTGCRVAFTSMTNIEPAMQYKVEIIPESIAAIGSFDFLVESKWVQVNGNSCEVGFSIISFPKAKKFQRYVDYLSWRYFQGNSMTKDNYPTPLL